MRQKRRREEEKSGHRRLQKRRIRIRKTIALLRFQTTFRKSEKNIVCYHNSLAYDKAKA